MYTESRFTARFKTSGYLEVTAEKYILIIVAL
jgi:hypothetical protein